MNVIKEQLEDLYMRQNLSTLQCAKALGYSSRGGIIHYLHKFGIKLRPRCKSSSRMAKVTKARLENLYIEQGLTTRQCAKVLGLPTNGPMTWWLRKFGIKSRLMGFQVGNQINKGRDPESNSNWKGGKKAVNCSYCGEELPLRFPSHIYKDNFCNHFCKGEWEAENLKGEANPNYGNSILAGENNPNWRGGIGCEPYAPIWIDKRFKAGIRERDNHKCQNPDCRGTDKTLTIHHVDYDKKNCESENLITLCRSCNGRANFNRDFWQAGYKEIIRKKYQADNQQILTNHAGTEIPA